jgi:hypothetical protein
LDDPTDQQSKIVNHQSSIKGVSGEFAIRLATDTGGRLKGSPLEVSFDSGMATDIVVLRSVGGVAMKWDCPLGHRHHSAFWPMLLMLGLVSIAGARVLFRSSMILPVTGGETQLIGSIVAIPDGAAEVISVPEGTRLRMDFHRFNTRVQCVASHAHSDDELNFYGPTLCWNGQGFEVVASTLSRAVFLVLDHDGQTVRGPQELPDLPYGGRTAGFRILWTGTRYAVFGMWLEKSNPLQDLGSGTFYSHGALPINPCPSPCATGLRTGRVSAGRVPMAAWSCNGLTMLQVTNCWTRPTWTENGHP